MSFQDHYDFLTLRESLDHPAYNCPVDKLVSFLRSLRDEHGYTLLVDITAIDWGENEPVRYTGVYHLHNLTTHEYMRITADCQSPTKPSLPSLTDVFPAADWHERETYDMFGITFDNHPSLKRILMWEGYPYYPLRKDFPLAGIETELPGEDPDEQSAAPVLPAPMMGGPFTATPGKPMSDQEPRAKDQSWTEKDEARFRRSEDQE